MSGAAAQRATRCGSCVSRLAGQLRRHIGRDQPVAAQCPALAAVAAVPHAAAGDRDEHAASVARVGRDAYGCRHRHSRRRTISRAPARSTARSPAPSARRGRRTRTARPAARRPTAGPAHRRRRLQASRPGTASARPRRRRETPAPASSVHVCAVVVGAMQLAAEMAVLEHGVERAVARIVQRGGDRDAGKIGARDRPAAVLARERAATPCASPTRSFAVTHGSTSRQSLHDVKLGIRADALARALPRAAAACRRRRCRRACATARVRRARSRAHAAIRVNTAAERGADGVAAGGQRTVGHEFPQPAGEMEFGHVTEK